MCGIIGLFLKQNDLNETLGEHFVPMLTTMTERGPDSTGIAIYGNPSKSGKYKYSLFHADENFDWNHFENRISDKWKVKREKQLGRYLILSAILKNNEFDTWLKENFPSMIVMSVGNEMEIYKDTGSPACVAEKYDLSQTKGYLMIGHTRMATETVVNVEGAHPYSFGLDMCLVHNGSYANHNSIRRVLEDDGMEFNSWNDTEVAAKYIEWRLKKGDDLNDALKNMMIDFSGFYTLTIGLKNQFAVMRDICACKPMVIAENKTYVAVASEFRALAHLPEINEADIYEPQPEEIHIWSK